MTQEQAIPFTLISHTDGLAALCRTLAGQPAVAVDSESNALYAYQERVCLIQLAIPGAEYLVDPLAGLDLAPLVAILEDPAVQKVFHAATQDIAGLKRDLGCSPANLFDTMWAARILGWPQLGLAHILHERFGVWSDKRYQRYNWGERPLRREALEYARLDVRYLLALRDQQMAELAAAGRTAEADEIFAQLPQTPPAEPAYGPSAFWRVKGVYDLPDRQRAILRELYLWRDGEARRRNRPPFKVMNDATLVEVAIARPHSRGELASIGLSRYLEQRYGPALLAAVARGERGPIPRTPRRPRHDEATLSRFEALRSWRLRTATARGVASDVILSTAALWALAERNPTTIAEMAGLADMGTWRVQTYGPSLLRVLHPQDPGDRPLGPAAQIPRSKS